MRAAAVVVALAEMGALLRPRGAQGAAAVEVLVETVEMSLFRPATRSVAVAEVVEVWDLVRL
jgi:hypothetical protein